jgi:CRISPR-associated protein Cas5d
MATALGLRDAVLMFRDRKTAMGRPVMSTYSVSLEVAGPLAMFTRPDTGGTPTSYPVPTWSAAKAIFESVAMLRNGDAWINPTKVEICKRRGQAGGEIKYQRYTTNYGGPLRKGDLISKGAGMQLFATAVGNACYRLYGDIAGKSAGGGVNPRHHLQDLFNRRIKQGRCHRTPSLGWREFTCFYWGPFRNDEYEVDERITLTITSMLVSMWSSPLDGRYAPRFAQNVRIERGVLRYAE